MFKYCTEDHQLWDYPSAEAGWKRGPSGWMSLWFTEWISFECWYQHGRSKHCNPNTVETQSNSCSRTLRRLYIKRFVRLYVIKESWSYRKKNCIVFFGTWTFKLSVFSKHLSPTLLCQKPIANGRRWRSIRASTPSLSWSDALFYQLWRSSREACVRFSKIESGLC